MKKSQGQLVYEYMCRPDYVPTTAYNIMTHLGFSIKSDSRLTELKQAGFIKTWIPAGSERGVFEVIDKNRAYNHLEIIATRHKKEKRGDTLSNQIGNKMGSLMVQIAQLNMSTDMKKEYINKLLYKYTGFMANRTHGLVFMAEMKMFEKDLQKKIEEITVKL